MTIIKAKVIEAIPANRLLALAGEGSVEDRDNELVYIKTSQLGWIPDFVTSTELEEGQDVSVVIRNNPVWKVEASQFLPAGTQVMSDNDGKVKVYRPEEGNHIGFTTHSVEEGEVVEVVRKYGQMPDNQVDEPNDPEEPEGA